MSDADLKARRNLIKWAKHRAKKKGIPFDLTVDDIEIPSHCPVLSTELVLGTDKPGDASPSLDRIDPKKGYVRGNVQVVSYRANRLKADASLMELLQVYAHYSFFLIRKLQGDQDAD